MALQITYRTKINGVWDSWRSWFNFSIPFSAPSTNPDATAIEYKARDAALVQPYSLGIQDVLYNGGAKFIIIIPTNTSEYSSGEILATTGSGHTYYTNESATACDGDDDCPDGYKCVNGECVPCEKLVDGKGIVTLWGVQMSDGSILSDGLDVDISSGVGIVNSDLLAFTAGRIQIFNGMSGTLTVKAGIGILGSDFGANVTLSSGFISGHYQDFIFDSGNLPFGYTFNGKVIFEILNYDTLGDCADDDVDDTPDDPPIDVVDGGEPEPPGGSGPGTVTPPGVSNTIVKVIIIKPTPPENTCDCEKYLADALYYNFDSLGNRLIDLTNSFDARLSEQNSLIHSLFSDQNRILFEQLSESNRLSYELSLFLGRKLYPQLVSAVSSLQSLRDDIRLMRIELESIHDEIESIDDTLDKALILPECGSEPEKGLVEVFYEFSQKYEPVDVVVEESDIWQQSPDEAPRNYSRKF